MVVRVCCVDMGLAYFLNALSTFVRYFPLLALRCSLEVVRPTPVATHTHIYTHVHKHVHTHRCTNQLPLSGSSGWCGYVSTISKRICVWITSSKRCG